MDSHHPGRGPVLVIWALVVVIFAGLVVADPANLIPLSLVLVAYAGIARWIDPNCDEQTKGLPKPLASQSPMTNQDAPPKSRAA